MFYGSLMTTDADSKECIGKEVIRKNGKMAVLSDKDSGHLRQFI